MVRRIRKVMPRLEAASGLLKSAVKVLLALLPAGFLIGGILTVVYLPGVIVDLDSAGAELPAVVRATVVSSTRQGVLLGLGGVLAVVGVVISYLRHRLEQNVADQAKIDSERRDSDASRNFDLKVDENRTSRYSSAVAQLASAHEDVQLGGVYALERLAQDSQSDRNVIYQVLSASLKRRGSAEREIDALDGSVLPRTISAVELAITLVLSRSKNVADLYLRDADLSGLDMTNYWLPGADLRGANLMGANLSGANLAGAFLDGANVQGLRLRGATLDKVRWGATDPTAADLRSATLRETNLFGMRLQRGPLDYEPSEMPDFGGSYWWDEPGWPEGLDAWVTGPHILDGMVARLPA